MIGNERVLAIPWTRSTITDGLHTVLEELRAVAGSGPG